MGGSKSSPRCGWGAPERNVRTEHRSVPNGRQHRSDGYFANIRGARFTPVFAADGTFTIFEDSGARTRRGKSRPSVAGAATGGNIFDRSTWPPPCEVQWRYRAAIGGNATWPCPARNTGYLRLGSTPPVDLECRSVGASRQAVGTAPAALLASEPKLRGEERVPPSRRLRTQQSWSVGSYLH